MVQYSHLFKNSPQYAVIHIVKGFGVVNKTEVGIFLALSYFFDDPADVGNLISGSSAFSKSSLNIWKFTVHILLKPGLEDFKDYILLCVCVCVCVCVYIHIYSKYMTLNRSCSKYTYLCVYPPNIGRILWFRNTLFFLLLQSQHHSAYNRCQITFVKE